MNFWWGGDMVSEFMEYISVNFQNKDIPPSFNSFQDPRAPHKDLVPEEIAKLFR